MHDDENHDGLAITIARHFLRNRQAKMPAEKLEFMKFIYKIFKRILLIEQGRAKNTQQTTKRV